MGGVNEGDDDRVIKIRNICPFDAFTNIIILFLLDRQLNEELLKLFVAVIDDELLESIPL